MAFEHSSVVNTRRISRHENHALAIVWTLGSGTLGHGVDGGHIHSHNEAGGIERRGAI